LAGYVVNGGCVVSKESTREIPVMLLGCIIRDSGGEMTRGATVAAVAEDMSLPSALASAIPMTEIRSSAIVLTRPMNSTKKDTNYFMYFRLAR
jgi:hypothetical protein